MKKDISISVASAGADKNVTDITVYLKSNNTHIMCNEIDNAEPQAIEKNSNGSLICQDDHNMFANMFVKYKASKLKM